MRHDTTTGNEREASGLACSPAGRAVRLSGNASLAGGAHAPNQPRANAALNAIVDAAARPARTRARLVGLNTFSACVAELARLMPLHAHEITDESRKGRAHILSMLACTLRHQRQKARTGHWDYQPARHAQLYRLFQHMRAIHVSL